ncbi:MAG: C40 family peptidase [Bacteroidales bacterium]|nr:C40 family peptidase [Bacteroidales bacterium]
MIRHIGWVAALLVALSACGTMRRSPKRSEPPAILPLTDSADIVRSRERAQAVMDSIDRIESGIRAGIPREQITVKNDKPAGPVIPKDLVDELLDYARTFIGTPYLWGASGPNQFDCSGFTSYVFREFGYNLPHNSTRQFQETRPVERFGELRKGDLVFFGERRSIRNIGHVGIVIDIDLEHGMFWFIHASTSHGVEIQRSTLSYYMMRYIGAGRVLPD